MKAKNSTIAKEIRKVVYEDCLKRLKFSPKDAERWARRAQEAFSR
jgi:hypothetical protein